MLLAAAFALLAGCATKPENIDPATTMTYKFAGLSCDELLENVQLAEAQREKLYKRQKGARTRDGWLNVLIIGAGAITQDYDIEIAQVKGDIIALQDEIRKRECEYQPRQETSPTDAAQDT